MIKKLFWLLTIVVINPIFTVNLFFHMAIFSTPAIVTDATKIMIL